MFKDKQKVKLSDSLQLGVSGPASQSRLFKIGGTFFLILSLFLAANIYRNYKDFHAIALSSPAQSTESKVLGAYDEVKTAQPKIITYTIQKGDTLFNIAHNHGMQWQIIATLNNLKAPYNLKPGATLQVPIPN